MYRIDNATSAGAPPVVPGAGAEGYFTNGTPPVTPATIVDDWWCNMIQEEMRNLATLRGAATDKTNNAQAKTALEDILALRADVADTGTVTNTWLRSVLVSQSSKATGAMSLVAASSDSDATGISSFIAASAEAKAKAAYSAMLAIDSIDGDDCDIEAGCEASFVAAVQVETGSMNVEVSGSGGCNVVLGVHCDDEDVLMDGTTEASAIIASTTTGGGHYLKAHGIGSVILACKGGDVGSLYSATIASTFSQGGTSAKSHCVVIASDTCQAEENESFVAASNNNSLASGNASAVVASDGSDATGITSAVLAADGCDAGGNACAVVASHDMDASTTDSFAAACAGSISPQSDINQPYSAMIAARRSNIGISGGVGSTMLVSSDRANLGTERAVALGYHVDTTPTFDSTDRNLTVRIEGTTGDGYWDGTGDLGAADYAELFENAELGTLPVGSLVAFDKRSGGKVRLANGSDSMLAGVVSAAPAIVGNSASLGWKGRFEVDAFGARRTKNYPMVKWAKGPKGSETAEYDGPIADAPPRDEWPEGATTYSQEWFIPVPSFDAAATYVPRRSRPDEWTVIGLLGQLCVRVDESVEPGDFVKSSKGGIGKQAETATAGASVYCMELHSEYDAERGYAVAMCLVR